MKQVVLLAGGSASGKSTLVEGLALRLREAGSSVATLSLDTYFRRTDPTAPQVWIPEENVHKFDCNHPETADVVAASEALDSAEADFVLFEGHFALVHPSLRQRASLSAYLEVPDDVRAVRRILRDMKTGRSGGSLEAIAAYYLASAHPGHLKYVAPSRIHADLVLDGTLSAESLIETLFARLKLDS